MRLFCNPHVQGMLFMEFGKKLRDLRQARGLTLRGLSSALEKKGITISHASLATWENDKGMPSRENLADICKFYNIEPSWLMFSVDSNENNQELVDSIAKLNNIDTAIIAEIIEVLQKNAPEKYLRKTD